MIHMISRVTDISLLFRKLTVVAHDPLRTLMCTQFTTTVLYILTTNAPDQISTF